MIDFVLRSAGAEGVAFMVQVIVSLSSCSMVSGVPCALKSVVNDPVPVPVKFFCECSTDGTSR